VTAADVVPEYPSNAFAPWLTLDESWVYWPTGTGCAQALLGYAPWQNWPPGHMLTLPLMHPSELGPHWTTVVPLLQNEPFCRMGSEQALGGAGHVQSALGHDPAHGLLIGHVRVDAVTMQPVIGSTSHVAKTLPGRQTRPAPLVQSVGGGRQVHVAVPPLPVHCLPAPQTTFVVAPRQPLFGSMAHVTTLLFTPQ
jgi:hypothetical protein